MADSGITIRLHVVRPLLGAHEWWRSGARLRTAFRALDDDAVVATRLLDASPGEVHAWAAARTGGDVARGSELARRWLVSVQRTLDPETRLWTELALGPPRSARPQLDGLAGFEYATTLAVPLEGWTIPLPEQPRRVRLRWTSNVDKLDHFSVAEAGDEAGTIVTAHERRAAIRGGDLETLSLDNLEADLVVPPGFSLAALIDGTTGRPLSERRQPEHPAGCLLTARSGLRLIGVRP